MAGAQRDQLRHEPQGQRGGGAGSQGKEGANCLVVRNSCGSTGEKGIDGNLKLTLKNTIKNRQELGTAMGKATIVENCEVDLIL